MENVQMYKFRDFYIRPQMMDAINRYIENRLYPGSFLAAVICNDLVGACQCADDENLVNLPAFTSYFYNEAPGNCWGSAEIMDAWINNKKEK